MFEVFKKYILEKVNLTEEELALIRSYSVIKKLRRRQYLLQEGEVNRYKAFITKGCLRQYRIGDNGEEHIMRFGIETWWMSDMESYTSISPSKSFIDALEESEVLMWAKEDWDELLIKIPKIGEFQESLLNRSFNAKENRIHVTISYTAEQKYSDFITSFPEIYNRVPLHMIASYLGISRETLSRIRHHFALKPEFNHK
ncbi:Crp/Fnr family transcriptional regulator [Dyadobacter subterraneus]|uniref:Crp/Fnr family transcriptional regulator n=1 Tax=Dyadobacter subterraneus TaxID=2773304 RepID=A0ABR9WMC3_9BACT|nr:Crp/Fnr family transcriptional regulator [Dyadobacter subterraneus]MBE9466642.1 Crp/Fnr family transcriptional regulator [Dyadobacter subterraneus]